MTTPNKFESAARLVKARAKLQKRRTDKLDAVNAKFNAEDEALLASVPPEVRALVLAEEGYMPQPPTPSILDGHMPPDVMAAVLDPDPLPAIGGVEVDRATGKARRV